MLKPKQQKFVELMALGTMTQKDIAKEINVTEHTICNWKKDNEIMREVDTIVRNNIRSSAAKALRVHQDLLGSKNEMVRYLTAKDILDRAGYKPEDMIRLAGRIPIIIHNDLDD